LFRPGGAWDYKHFYTPGTADYQQAQDFGNFDFGAVLRGLGFNVYTTLNAAGVAQIYICASGRACGVGIPGLVYPFGDQLTDTVNVLRGFDYEGVINTSYCNGYKGN
jgi:Bacterial toxin 44